MSAVGASAPVSACSSSSGVTPVEESVGVATARLAGVGSLQLVVGCGVRCFGGGGRRGIGSLLRIGGGDIGVCGRRLGAGVRLLFVLGCDSAEVSVGAATAGSPVAAVCNSSSAVVSGASGAVAVVESVVSSASVEATSVSAVGVSAPVSACSSSSGATPAEESVGVATAGSPVSAVCNSSSAVVSGASGAVAVVESVVCSASVEATSVSAVGVSAPVSACSSSSGATPVEESVGVASAGSPRRQSAIPRRAWSPALPGRQQSWYRQPAPHRWRRLPGL